MASSNFGRRDFLKAAAAMSATAAIPGLFPGVANAARTNELNILVWEGYNSDNVLDPFRREFDTKVSAENVISDPDAVNKLRAGETKVWDLINLNNPWARELLYPEG